MADILTHSFIGASICPGNPLLGAGFGLLPDAIQLPMNIYTLVKYRKFAVGSYWHLAPGWMRELYNAMHGIFLPAAAMIYAWMFIPGMFPFMLAYSTHALMDAYLHDTTTILYPLRKAPVTGCTQNWWESKGVMIALPVGALIIMATRLGWI